MSYKFHSDESPICGTISVIIMVWVRGQRAGRPAAAGPASRRGAGHYGERIKCKMPNSSRYRKINCFSSRYMKMCPSDYILTHGNKKKRLNDFIFIEMALLKED